jgi:hypothetical protein
MKGLDLRPFERLTQLPVVVQKRRLGAKIGHTTHHTRRLPQPSTDAASRFCSLRLAILI